MSFAFPALLILILALPGMVFKRGFNQASLYPERKEAKSLPEELANGVIFSLIIHIIGIWILGLWGQYVHYDVIIKLLMGGLPKEHVGGLFAVINNQALAFCEYMLALYFCSYLFGFTFRKILNNIRVDLFFHEMASYTPWHYLFTGEQLYLSDAESKLSASRDFWEKWVPLVKRYRFTRGIRGFNRPDGLLISSVVELGSEAYLYYGVVSEYTVTEGGDIDTVYLSAAHRRQIGVGESLKQKSEGGDDTKIEDVIDERRFYAIDGDLLVLKGTEIKTLNYNYFWLREKPKPDVDDSKTSDLGEGLTGVTKC